ncbi:MAG: hypothetical protein PF436_01285 [Prolixibacteraceae bacterium]|nr:hypothetical protein [Prolixibacteraceae bacterium]
MKHFKNSSSVRHLLFSISIVFVLIISSHGEAFSQIVFTGGGNFSTVRSKVLLENKKPVIGYNCGISVQYYPFKKSKNISLINEMILSRKGYRQQFDEKYFFRFNYLSFPVLINLRPKTWKAKP